MTKFKGRSIPCPRVEDYLCRAASLVQAYIAALPGTVVSIVASADGKRSRFETGAVPALEIVHSRLRFQG